MVAWKEAAPPRSMGRSASGRIPLRAAAGLLAAFLLALPCAAAAPPQRGGQASEERLAGLSLAAALHALQARGLPVFFSSQVVRDAMRVEAEPRGATPRQVLDELLRPHGLEAVAGPGGRLVVVPARRPAAALAGRVRPRGEDRPLADVRIVVDGGRAEALTGADGRFAVAGLAPGAHTVEAYRPGFVIGRERVEVPAPAGAEILLELDPAPFGPERITVTAEGREPTRGEPFAARVLDPARPDGGPPRLGDDVFRAAGALPGAAQPEASSRLSVRGGRDDEVLVVLDGLELLAPFHLQEFDSALSIVAPGSLGRVELLPGSYPAEYGDRMSGLLDMTSLRLEGPSVLDLGVGSLYAEAAASRGLGRLGATGDIGDAANHRGHWFGTARGGTYRLALEVAERHENPRYWDVFGKVDLRPGEGRHDFRLDALAAEDTLEIAPAGPSEERYASRWGNSYLWFRHAATLGENGLAESVAWLGHLDRSRSGGATGDGAFAVRDRRELDFTGAKSVWRLQPHGRLSLFGGAEARQIRSRIDYLAASAPSAAPALGGRVPGAATRFAGAFDFEQSAAFAGSRLYAGDALTVEAGLRFDHTGLTGESHLSPRLDLAWRPGERGVARLSWGWFYQSQRPYELAVEDGETEIARDERAENVVLGFERRLAGGARWRAEVYRRRWDRPRVRYENLFDPAVLYPELAADRVRVAPESGRARGIELEFRDRRRGPFSWSAAWVLSSVADRVEGRLVPRATDQPQAFRLGLGWLLPGGWSLDAAWLYHTGWPTTEVGARLVPDAGGGLAVEPVLGPLRGARLPDDHRLDVRLSRSWQLSRGRLSAYLDLQNLYDRENLRGFEGFAFERGEGGEPLVRSRAVTWGGLLPSFGIRWRL